MNGGSHGHGTQPEFWEPVEPDIPALRSLARELVGNPVKTAPSELFDVDPDEPPEPEPPRPASMLELDRYDQIVSFGTVEAPPRRRALDSIRYEHLMVCKWLDRFGFMTTEQLRRAVLPDASLRATQDLLRRMRDAGLVERRRVQLSIEEGRRRGGSAPRVYALTPAGYRLGQRSPGIWGSVIPRTGGRRRSEAATTMHLRHDLHALGWWQAFEAVLGPGVGVSDVLTPRYEEGRFRAPRIHIARGRGWRAVELRDILLGEAHIAGIPNEPFDYTLEPDLTIRLEVMGWLIGKTDDIKLDLLVEIDRTQKPAKSLRKFARYDQFLTGWGLLHPRVEQLGTRPVVVFTSPNEPSMRALMKAADEVMTGRIGWAGDPLPSWYYPGRDHVLFTTEPEIHHRSTRAWPLPKLPRELRDQLGYEGFLPSPVTILPAELTVVG
jgi:hypothetical protein